MYIIRHSLFKGDRWGKKLTLLEGFAAAAMLMFWAREAQLRGAEALMVDNIGFCFASQNGSSRDEMIWTVAKFIQV